MSYYEKKEEIRLEAIAFQASFTEGKTYYYSELADISYYFEKMGKRYGLLTEFKENGII